MFKKFAASIFGAFSSKTEAVEPVTRRVERARREVHKVDEEGTKSLNIPMSQRMVAGNSQRGLSVFHATNIHPDRYTSIRKIQAIMRASRDQMGKDHKVTDLRSLPRAYIGFPHIHPAHLRKDGPVQQSKHVRIAILNRETAEMLPKLKLDENGNAIWSENPEISAHRRTLSKNNQKVFDNLIQKDIWDGKAAASAAAAETHLEDAA